MKIKIEVTNQELKLHPSQAGRLKVIADSKNYLIASFNFRTEEWKDKLIYALFTYEGKTYKKILGAEGLEDNECYIPPEVIKNKGFTVSIYSKTETLERITTDCLKIKVETSGYTENAVNDNTTPTVLEQLESKLFKYCRLCNDILEECRAIKSQVEGDK